jgi:hypothetical protein
MRRSTLTRSGFTTGILRLSEKRHRASGIR